MARNAHTMVAAPESPPTPFIGRLVGRARLSGTISTLNDGWKDLFVARSHVLDNVERIDPSLHYLEPPLLVLNHHGHFDRADLGSDTPIASRGAAFGDLNNDGWMDAVVSVLGGPPLLFLNRGGALHWLKCLSLGIVAEALRRHFRGGGVNPPLRSRSRLRHYHWLTISLALRAISGANCGQSQDDHLRGIGNEKGPTRKTGRLHFESGPDSHRSWHH
jgi:hypothetical protein